MIVERLSKNPILIPHRHQSWEADAVFNGCPVLHQGSIYLLYRAVSLPHFHSAANTTLKVSDVGIAKSKDGVHFSARQRFIVPDMPWDRFGCEDPRVTALEGMYYIFYTALSEYPFRADGIRVGVAVSADLQTIKEKHLVTSFNAKAMALFPERVNGKIWAVLSVNTDRPPTHICLASFDTPQDMWVEDYWQEWYRNLSAQPTLPLQRTPYDHVEVGAPPLKTKAGWLLLYSYIKNYSHPHQVFGVEAVLLDLKDPRHVIARTLYPLLTAEEYYEKIGIVPNVVFPSGALIRRGKVYLYYGAADTVCCLAFISLKGLLQKLTAPAGPLRSLWAREQQMFAPIADHPWESKAVFNPAAVYLNGKVHLLYRAMSHDNTSVLGYANSTNGFDIDERLPEPVYVPREVFEQKVVPGANSGCEDPRLTKMGTKFYMCYTAYDGKNPPRVALTSIHEKDFLERKWNWAKPVLISPPGCDDKDACLFPEKINSTYLIIHRSGDDIDLSFHASLAFDGKTWLEEYRWIAPRKGMWDSRKVGIAAPPLKTDKGWLVLYHGISDDDGQYRVGAVLADVKDPTRIIARTDESLFEPRMPFEKLGQVSNVVFPCGAVIRGGDLYMYFGAADQVVGAASLSLATLWKTLDMGSL
ncbi:MAG: hypothetical protein WC659_01775 [Patescibacteria group bacterium]